MGVSANSFGRSHLRSREINLNTKVAGVIGDDGIYLKDAQRITGIPKQPNLEKDRQQESSGDGRDK